LRAFLRELGFGRSSVDRCPEEFHAYRSLPSKEHLNGIVVDAAVVVCVAETSAESLVVRERSEFILEGVDEKTGARDVKDFDDTIDERPRGVESDASFLFTHQSVYRSYTYLDFSRFTRRGRGTAS
jgi:hypothetical protein